MCLGILAIGAVLSFTGPRWVHIASLYLAFPIASLGVCLCPGSFPQYIRVGPLRMNTFLVAILAWALVSMGTLALARTQLEWPEWNRQFADLSIGGLTGC